MSRSGSERIATGRPDTYYFYDPMGMRTQTVVDVDGDTEVDTDGLDRITGTDARYEKDGNDWWRVTRSTLYAHDGADTVTTNSISRTRLTGFTPAKMSEEQSIDIHTNVVTSISAVDREAQTTLPGVGP